MATKTKVNEHQDLIDRIDVVVPTITRGDHQVRDLLLECRDVLAPPPAEEE